VEVFPMICPKCDSRFYEDEHCSFCGFVLTRHPTAKEMIEAGRGIMSPGKKKQQRANFQRMNKDSVSEYSIDDYSIMKLEQERFIREAM
jgi:transposase-like protein